MRYVENLLVSSYCSNEVLVQERFIPLPEESFEEVVNVSQSPTLPTNSLRHGGFDFIGKRLMHFTSYIHGLYNGVFS